MNKQEIIFAFSVGLLVLAVAAHGQSPETDREVLAAFYEATGGDGWRDNTNWLTDAPLGEWFGVETDEQGRVVLLVLPYNQLNGGIPAGLARLSELQVLHISGNYELTGQIPPEFGRLTNLRALELGENRLTGPIPPELGQLIELNNLAVFDNNLTGPIPPELGQLSAGQPLRGLQLRGNELSGSIPRELGQLIDLRFLTLEVNDLSGPIPVEMGNLTELEHLSLDSRSGLCLPPEIQETVFGRLARERQVRLCGAVPAVPAAGLWVMAFALIGLGCAVDARRRKLEKEATPGSTRGVGRLP